MTRARSRRTPPPALLGVYSYDGVTVGVTFSEPMELASIADPQRYSIVGTTVTNAIPGADARAVTLHLATRLPEEFAVTVSGCGTRRRMKSRPPPPWPGVW